MAQKHYDIKIGHKDLKDLKDVLKELKEVTKGVQRGLEGMGKSMSGHGMSQAKHQLKSLREELEKTAAAAENAAAQTAQIAKRPVSRSVQPRARRYYTGRKATLGNAFPQVGASGQPVTFDKRRSTSARPVIPQGPVNPAHYGYSPSNLPGSLPLMPQQVEVMDPMSVAMADMGVIPPGTRFVPGPAHERYPGYGVLGNPALVGARGGGGAGAPAGAFPLYDPLAVARSGQVAPGAYFEDRNIREARRLRYMKLKLKASRGTLPMEDLGRAGRVGVPPATDEIRRATLARQAFPLLDPMAMARGGRVTPGVPMPGFRQQFPIPNAPFPGLDPMAMARGGRVSAGAPLGGVNITGLPGPGGAGAGSGGSGGGLGRFGTMGLLMGVLGGLSRIPGMSGALTGAVAGSPLGPAGVVIGSNIGLGIGLGTYASGKFSEAFGPEMGGALSRREMIQRMMAAGGTRRKPLLGGFRELRERTGLDDGDIFSTIMGASAAANVDPNTRPGSVGGRAVLAARNYGMSGPTSGLLGTMGNTAFGVVNTGMALGFSQGNSAGLFADTVAEDIARSRAMGTTGLGTIGFAKAMEQSRSLGINPFGALNNTVNRRKRVQGLGAFGAVETGADFLALQAYAGGKTIKTPNDFLRARVKVRSGDVDLAGGLDRLFKMGGKGGGGAFMAEALGGASPEEALAMELGKRQFTPGAVRGGPAALDRNLGEAAGIGERRLGAADQALGAELTGKSIEAVKLEVLEDFSGMIDTMRSMVENLARRAEQMLDSP